jgi:hypothetical protein
MIHLLAGLLRPHDPGLFALVIVETLLGCGATMSLLRTPNARWSTFCCSAWRARWSPG